MKRLFICLIFIFFGTTILGLIKNPPATKKIKVVTTLSVLKSLVKEIGGDKVEVTSLCTAKEDPHFVKAKSTFKRLINEADLFIQIGRSLEPWVPQVLSASGNNKLANGGVVIASLGVKTLEVPQKLTRESGDIHPEGNPHIWLSPVAAKKMAENIKNALIAKDMVNKSIYEKNYLAFKTKLAKAMFGDSIQEKMVDFLFRLHAGNKLKEYAAKRKMPLLGWVKMAQSIDYPFITYHTVWSYLADEFGLKIFAQIEEKSGVAPSLRYQNELVKRAKANNVKRIVAASYYLGYGKLIEFIATQISGKKIFIDADCHENETYIDMMNRIIKNLVDFRPIPEVLSPKSKNPPRASCLPFCQKGDSLKNV